MDRIYEAYIGDMGEAFMKATRKRLEWICSQTKGDTVLDVGCSQGIGSILVAQTGKCVKGIDINGQAIDFANKLLAEKYSELTNKVSFECADFSAFSGETRYDCIVISEVLEHLLYPELFVERAYRFLRPEGVLVVTVPFGINDDPDHKQTFYYWSLRKILDCYFTVSDTVFFGKWLGIALLRREEPCTAEAPITLSEGLSVEQAFYNVERELVDKLRDTNEKYRQTVARVAEKNARIDELNKSVAEKTKRLEETSEQLKTVSEQLGETSEQLRETDLQLTTVNRRLTRARADLSATTYHYNALANSKLGRLTRWYWKIKDAVLYKLKNFSLKSRLRSMFSKNAETVSSAGAPANTAAPAQHKLRAELPSVTVIIPSYKLNDYLDTAVESVLKQTYDDVNKIRVIISVNGKDKDYADFLCRKYSNTDRVRVIYTPKAGSSAGRNHALLYTFTECFTFLDDDDFFTNGYLKEMAQHMDSNISCVCGRLCDLHDDGTIDENTYINRCLEKFGACAMADYSKVGTLFSSPCAKLYRTVSFVQNLGRFDETCRHTEDVVFWVENIYKLPNEFFLCSAHGKEALVRRVVENSLSRPTDDRAYSFYVSDRILLLRRFVSALSMRGKPLAYKRFVLSKIDATNKIMQGYYNSCDRQLRDKIRQETFESNCPLLNTSFFAEKKAIAFCHNFSPATDASAFVASIRLNQISRYQGEPLAWTVVCADMSACRKTDQLWDSFYAKFQYKEKIVTEGRTYFSEKAQWQWGNEAFDQVKDVEVPLIYSRSMWAGSHVAALKYKNAHPDTVWFAEFSDPLYMGSDGCERPASRHYEGEDEKFNTFWKDIESEVLENADKVIFTNENQKQYMLAHNCVEKAEEIGKKAIVWHHPKIEAWLSDIAEIPFALNKNLINIAYFGSFYANRSAGSVFDLLKNERVQLHIFTSITDELVQQVRQYGDRVVLHPLVSKLEVLATAKEMDYLFLNDMDFKGELNPYLPSKLADYLSTGTKVLAYVYPNTAMSKINDENLIKISSLSDELVQGLTKTKGENLL